MMPRKEWLLSVAGVLFALVLAEIGARCWIAIRWPAGMAYELTHATDHRGRFASDPWNGYGLTASFSNQGISHSAHAFRGAEIPAKRRPGIARIAIVGASTVYGPRVRDAETSSVRLGERLAAMGIRAEVLNGGVPGWTTRETLLSLKHRVLPLGLDFVVVVDGRNDSYPQLFRNYRDDYLHYRDPRWTVRSSNLAWKRVFRFSNLVMGLMHRHSGLGFSPDAEHPLYGGIRYENKPTPEEARTFAADPARFAGFARNLRAAVAMIRAKAAQPVLATIPYRGGPEYKSGNLGMEYEPVVSRAVAENQRLTREIAASEGVALVDTPELWTGEFLADDCHFNPLGERAFAARIADVLAPLLAARARAQ